MIFAITVVAILLLSATLSYKYKDSFYNTIFVACYCDVGALCAGVFWGHAVYRVDLGAVYSGSWDRLLS